jgi:hypothetical protein
MKIYKDYLFKKFFKCLIICLAFSFIFQAQLYAQENQSSIGGSSKPVMQSVFWNTVWGSTWGAVMGVSYHWLSGVKFRDSVVTSTTIGGVLGYGLGIYMVLNGLTFDKKYLLELPKPQLGPQPNAYLWNEESYLMDSRKISRKQPGSGWEATLFQFHF